MKTTILIIFILLSATLSAQIETGACEGFHMTGTAGLYILSDCVAEWLDLPPCIPFILTAGVCIGKELTDRRFSMNDMKWDGIGIGVGISLRFIDGGLR